MSMKVRGLVLAILGVLGTINTVYAQGQSMYSYRTVGMGFQVFYSTEFETCSINVNRLESKKAGVSEVNVFVAYGNYNTGESVCANYLLPSSALVENGKAVSINVDLSYLTPTYECGNMPALGVLNLTLSPDGRRYRSEKGKFVYKDIWYTQHHDGTSRSDSASVTGEAIGCNLQNVEAWITQDSTRSTTIVQN